MLADPAFCDMVQAIGVASLGADDKQVWHLTKVYWYTVEFGVVKEAGDIKAFGAGILSSFGELEYMKQVMQLTRAWGFSEVALLLQQQRTTGVCGHRGGTQCTCDAGGSLPCDKSHPMQLVSQSSSSVVAQHACLAQQPYCWPDLDCSLCCCCYCWCLGYC